MSVDSSYPVPLSAYVAPLDPLTALKTDPVVVNAVDVLLRRYNLSVGALNPNQVSLVDKILTEEVTNSVSAVAVNSADDLNAQQKNSAITKALDKIEAIVRDGINQPIVQPTAINTRILDEYDDDNASVNTYSTDATDFNQDAYNANANAILQQQRTINTSSSSSSRYASSVAATEIQTSSYTDTIRAQQIPSDLRVGDTNPVLRNQYQRPSNADLYPNSAGGNRSHDAGRNQYNGMKVETSQSLPQGQQLRLGPGSSNFSVHDGGDSDDDDDGTSYVRETTPSNNNNQLAVRVSHKRSDNKKKQQQQPANLQLYNPPLSRVNETGPEYNRLLIENKQLRNDLDTRVKFEQSIAATIGTFITKLKKEIGESTSPDEVANPGAVLTTFISVFTQYTTATTDFYEKSADIRDLINSGTTFSELNAANVTLKTTERTLNKELEDAKDKIDTVSSDYREATAALKTSRGEVDRLTKNLTSVVSDLEILRTKNLSAVTLQSTISDAKLAELNNIITTKNAELSENDTKMRKLGQEVVKQREESARISLEYTNYKDGINAWLSKSPETDASWAATALNYPVLSKAVSDYKITASDAKNNAEENAKNREFTKTATTLFRTFDVTYAWFSSFSAAVGSSTLLQPLSGFASDMRAFCFLLEKTGPDEFKSQFESVSERNSKWLENSSIETYYRSSEKRALEDAKTINTLRSEVSSLTSASSAPSSRDTEIDSLNKKLAGANIRISEYADQSQILNDKVDTAQIKISQLNSDITRLNKTIAAKTTELSDTQNRFDDYKKRTSELALKNSSLYASEVTKMSREKEAIETRLSRAINDVKQISMSIHLVTQNLKIAEAQRDKALGDLSTSESSASNLRNRLTVLEEERDNEQLVHQAEVLRLTNQLALRDTPINLEQQEEVERLTDELQTAIQKANGFERIAEQRTADVRRRDDVITDLNNRLSYSVPPSASGQPPPQPPPRNIYDVYDSFTGPKKNEITSIINRGRTHRITDNDAIRDLATAYLCIAYYHGVVPYVDILLTPAFFYLHTSKEGYDTSLIHAINTTITTVMLHEDDVISISRKNIKNPEDILSEYVSADFLYLRTTLALLANAV